MDLMVCIIKAHNFGGSGSGSGVVASQNRKFLDGPLASCNIRVNAIGWAHAPDLNLCLPVPKAIVRKTIKELFSIVSLKMRIEVLW